MKKVDKFMDSVDLSIEHHFGSVIKVVQKHFTVFSASILLFLISAFLIKVVSNRPYFIASIVSSDLKKITYALKAIDNECNVLLVTSGRTAINFLNVKKFAGSVIGGVNLVNPEKWQGPYLEGNPTLQQHFYELILGADGYYVVPGRGVTLPNGYTVGKEFDIDGTVGVEKLLQAGGFLNYQGGALAMKVEFKIKNMSMPLGSKKIEKINSMVTEFNQALPFTKNEHVPGQVSL